MINRYPRQEESASSILHTVALDQDATHSFLYLLQGSNIDQCHEKQLSSTNVMVMVEVSVYRSALICHVVCSAYHYVEALLTLCACLHRVQSRDVTRGFKRWMYSHCIKIKKILIVHKLCMIYLHIFGAFARWQR